MNTLQVLYHGNCLDGVVSAAIMTRFLLQSECAGAAVTYRGMAHAPRDPYGEDHAITFSADTNAVVDFRYSPSDRLHWWCDHHETSFLTPADQENFERRGDPRHCFVPSAPSCAGVLLRWLTEEHGFAGQHFSPLVEWVDLVDSAGFRDPTQAVELREPALQLMALLESAPGPELTDFLIEELQREELAAVHARPRIQQALAPVLQRHRESIDLFRARMAVRHGVATFDLTQDAVNGFNKFIPYYLDPHVRYTVGLTHSEQRSKVSVGSNPWDRPSPLTNLGALCKRYGGGGHAVVGAISLAPTELPAARKAYEEIIELLGEDTPG